VEYKSSRPPRFKNIHPVFHVSLLNPFYSWDDQLVLPDPISIGGEDDWEIDAILAKRVRYGKAQYYYSHLPRRPCKTRPINADKTVVESTQNEIATFLNSNY
jgi:hypothetical protein